MKIKKSVLFILFLLVIPNIFAIEIILSKDIYSPRETLHAEITGNFISLSSDNIFIYEDGVPRSDPVIKGLTKQGNIYYFYAVLPNKEGNFSLRIEDIDYIKSGELRTETLFSDFAIIRGDKALSINPGFLFADEILIRIKSLEGDSEVNMVLDETGETKTLFLIEDLEEIIKFSSEGIISRKSNLNINNYNIPIFLNKRTETFQKKIILDFIPFELTGTINPGIDYFFDLILKNSGKEDLTNIKLASDFEAVISPQFIDFLGAGENLHINVTINSEDKTENLTGKISAEIKNQTIDLSVLFKITEEETEVDLNGTSITETLSCLEIGEICLEGQNCEGEITSSLEGPCCIGKCIEKAKSNYYWIIGVLLLIILVFIIWYAYKKAKRKQKPKSTEEILREKSKKYKERMKGDEVFRKLDKV